MRVPQGGDRKGLVTFGGFEVEVEDKVDVRFRDRPIAFVDDLAVAIKIDKLCADELGRATQAFDAFVLGYLKLRP
jgi:hypothetical protein